MFLTCENMLKAHIKYVEDVKFMYFFLLGFSVHNSTLLSTVYSMKAVHSMQNSCRENPDYLLNLAKCAV